MVCAAPFKGRWVSSNSDCDDERDDIHPGARESCNGRDDDCDQEVDEGLVPRTRWYKDDDGDGFGAEDTAVWACAAPPGLLSTGGDCAPADGTKHPRAAELCNGLDDDCDDLTDEAPMADVDPDDAGTAAFPCLTELLGICRQGHFVCADLGVRRCVSLRMPLPLDVCNGLDDNCSGVTDEQPDCGGPASFIGFDAGIVRAFAVDSLSTATVTRRCQSPQADGGLEVATVDGVWTGFGANGRYHVLEYAAPAGRPWDLSRPDAKLRFGWTADFDLYAGGGGAWGSSSSGKYPAVALCGASDDELIRYVVANDPETLSDNKREFGPRNLQLNDPRDGGWLTGTGSGMDTARVFRIQLMVAAQTSRFTLHMTPDSGFSHP
jgi:hypothetical protein